MLILAVCFDVAIQFDDLAKLSFSAQGFRVFGLVLALFPVAMWVTLLSCIVRWQWSREIELLRGYDLSWWRCCQGLLMAIFILVLIWSGLRELGWTPLARHQTSGKKVVLLPFDQGRAVIEREASGEVSNIWIEHPSGEAQYQTMLYLEGEGWRLKEDSRMNNARLKQKYEEIFDEIYPGVLYLDLAFGEISRMSLFQICDLKHDQAFAYLLGVRLGLPALTLLWLGFSMVLIFFQSGKTLWFNWAVCFLLFVVFVSLIQRLFAV